MTEKEVIHVGLYGGKSIFGGREKPLKASIISCGMKDQCSLYKQGQCAAIRDIGNRGCKHGTETVKRGYTSRAQKYHKFKSEWRNHEKYGALSSNSKGLAIMGNEVYFSYAHITIEVDDDGRLTLDGPSFEFGNSAAWIPLDKFTTSLIKRICDYRPQAFMGGTIRAYQEEQVPLFLSHLKEVLPDLHREFINEYEGYRDAINYVGRKAYIHTLDPCDVRYVASTSRSLDEQWYWDGEHLVYKGGYIPKASVVSNYEIENFKIKPSKDATIEITDNDQVTEKTKFID